MYQSLLTSGAVVVAVADLTLDLAAQVQVVDLLKSVSLLMLEM
jgi:energy-converting hydrogenase Eha subunit C